jgi:hypothetical protein
MGLLMDAQFFCLDQHRSLSETIRSLLAASLGSSVAMQVNSTDSARHLGDLTSLGELYARLLAASIPPEQGLSVKFKKYDRLRGSPYMHSNSPPYTWTVSVPYFEEDTLAFFLPALAIRGRMALVPRGQNDVLQRLGGTSPLSPWAGPSEYRRDVIEVDFQDQVEIEDAVRSLAERVRREVDHDIGVYRALHPRAESPDIARSLEIDIDLLERQLRDAAGRANAYCHLRLALSTETVSFGRWTPVELCISNQSSSKISNVSVSVFSGPADIVPKRIELDLAALSTTVIRLSVKQEEPSEFPLEFKLALPNDDLLERWLPSCPIWLKAEIPKGR